MCITIVAKFSQERKSWYTQTGLTLGRNLISAAIVTKLSQEEGISIYTGGLTGEKPYNCSNCEKAFSKKRNLKMHTKTHVVEILFNDLSNINKYRK